MSDGRAPGGGVDWSAAEMMIVAAARALEGKRVCFVGVGLPNIAVNLAKRTVAPDLELVYEAGVFGARPARLPLSIGDPTIVTGATAAVSMFELFAFYLQGGLIDVGFLGAAQIDRFGNINTTVIGDYARPKTRHHLEEHRAALPLLTVGGARSRDERYPSAAALLQDLLQIQAGTGPLGPEARRAHRSRRVYRVAVASWMMAMAVVTILLVSSGA